MKAAFSESELLSAGAAAGSGAGQQQPGCAGVQIEEPGPLEAGGAAGSLPAPGEQDGEGELEGREAPPSRAWPRWVVPDFLAGRCCWGYRCRLTSPTLLKDLGVGEFSWEVATCQNFRETGKSPKQMAKKQTGEEMREKLAGGKGKDGGGGFTGLEAASTKSTAEL